MYGPNGIEGANSKLSFGRMDHLHDEVMEGAVDFLEPMRNAGRDDDDVAFFELLRFAAGDLFAPEFARAFGARIGDRTASNEGGGAFEDVKDVGFTGVLLGFASGVATTGVDFVFGSLEQGDAFDEAGGDFIRWDESNLGERSSEDGRASEDEDQGGEGKEKESGFQGFHGTAESGRGITNDQALIKGVNNDAPERKEKRNLRGMRRL